MRGPSTSSAPISGNACSSLSLARAITRGSGTKISWLGCRIVGSIGAGSSPSWAYWLDAAQQGKSPVTHACRVMVRHAFEEHQVQKVAISCAAAHQRSRAIAERLGFTQEGTLRRAVWFRDRLVDGICYGPLRSEWQAHGRGEDGER